MRGRNGATIGFNIVNCWTTLLVAALWPGLVAAQRPCPASAARQVRDAYTLYRRGLTDSAKVLFTAVDARCPGNLDAKLGLGFVALRQEQHTTADSLFRMVIRGDSTYADAWEGLASVAWRRGERAAADRASRRALALNPNSELAKNIQLQMDPEPGRKPIRKARRPKTLQLVSRIGAARFEVLADGKWQPFYLKGVNLGVALPGKFPSEFPADSARYAGWLDTLAAMHANVVRVYTVLPPNFYRALRGWNLRHPTQPIWLVHGVWTELPPHHDFDDMAWKDGFRAEMRRVVDLVHGQLEQPPRAGHAHGRYDADVSRWVLAYIIGREWEPFAVRAYDSTHARRSHAGRFLVTDDVPALDAWMAEQCDYLLSHEYDVFHALRPIAYTNWPTLDPLTHPTEANTDEEREWRRRAGRPFEGTRLEYENDAVSLDARLIRASRHNPAGWFASYHAYPYYPDFMVLDPEYAKARSTEGTSSYFGYLQALRQHHGDVPVVISEYGVPSSRGNAHLQPQGWHHGGHDEVAMAGINARLTREIREAGLAGGILFAWLDEWFKHNWIVIDFELPAERNRLWHNTMDAEQNYGILALLSGTPDRPAPGGDARSWEALESVHRRPDRSALRLGADASFLYVALELPELKGNENPFQSNAVQIALDTWMPNAGQHVLPGNGIRGDLGFEFVAEFNSKDDASLKVTPDYNRHAAPADVEAYDDRGLFFHRPITTMARADARWDSLFVMTNRARFGRDGSFYPARGINRGRLRHGTERENTLSDWYWDANAGVLQLRLAWDLLNVSDPSSATILYETTGQGDFGTVQTDGFRVGAALLTRESKRPVATWPALDAQGQWNAADFRLWRWKKWDDQPVYHQRLKPIYDSLRTLWK